MADSREIDIDPPDELPPEVRRYLHENFSRIRELLDAGVSANIDTGATPTISVVNGIVTGAS